MIMILSPSELIMRAIMENMNSPDHVLCFTPQIMEDNGFSFLKIEQFWEKKIENFENQRQNETLQNYILWTIFLSKR